MINKTKIIAERLHVSERHARRLIAEGDDKAQRILNELPDGDEAEFYWRLTEMMWTAVELGVVETKLWQQLQDYGQFFFENAREDTGPYILGKAVPILDKMMKTFIAQTPKRHATPLWDVFADLDEVLDLGGPWSRANKPESGRGQ